MQFLKRVYAAFVAPCVYFFRSGHVFSGLLRRSVDFQLKPIPWYTKPAIDFLSTRDFEAATVLEIGGGQSTFWWASRARKVVTFDQSKDWISKIDRQNLSNVEAFWVDRSNRDKVAFDVLNVLDERGMDAFDVIIVDGLERAQLAQLLTPRLSPSGLLVCDNSEGYGFFEVTRDMNLLRVDFAGLAPGVIKPHVTSVFSNHPHMLLSPQIKIGNPNDRD